MNVLWQSNLKQAKLLDVWMTLFQKSFSLFVITQNENLGQ